METSYSLRLIPERVVTSYLCTFTRRQPVILTSSRLTPAKSSIVSYDGGNIPVSGTVKIQVGEDHSHVCCCVVSWKANAVVPFWANRPVKEWVGLKLRILTLFVGLILVAVKFFLSKK